MPRTSATIWPYETHGTSKLQKFKSLEEFLREQQIRYNKNERAAPGKRLRDLLVACIRRLNSIQR